MSIKRIASALGAVALAALLAAPQSAASQATSTGLWPTGFRAQQAEEDCGRHRLDDNTFCVANDSRNGLEVGVKFRTSQQLQITGVRIYRVDTATVRASLWDAEGNLLARGNFPPGKGHTWQDMSFGDPVTIEAGKTYVASYFTPGTKYAFRYGHFAKTGTTVGPVTALRSVEGNPNGVHCYDDAACGSFPVRGFQDINYWTTPLWRVVGGATPTSTPTATPTETPTETPTTTPTGTPTNPSTGVPTTDRQAPRVTAAVPAMGARRVNVRVSVSVRFSETLNRTTLTRSSVRLLRKGSSEPVATRLRYDPATRRVVLDPLSALRPNTTYRVEVTSRVRDADGHRLDQFPTRAGLQTATWTFRTR